MTTVINKTELFSKVVFNAEGLVPVIIQDYENHKVLMMAYMNQEALEITLATKEVTFYSRSRQQLWKKGETSGNTQFVQEIYLDCDADTILIKVTKNGPACHTGEETCFFSQVADKE